MPNRDKTGPCGNGPRTGKGRGSCPNNNIVERGNRLVDRPCRRNRGQNGRGMGPRNRGQR